MNFYNENYEEFSNTRYSLWNSVEEFSKNFTKESSMLDAGCGNGKNMKHIKCKVGKATGFDNCKKFVEKCSKDGLDVIEADVRDIPYDDNSFDFIICIAVIHHLKNECERVKAMTELIRALKPGGKVLVTVWAFESDKYSMKRKFIKGDNTVTFNRKNRYYFVHDKDSFQDFCDKFPFEKRIFWDKGNWNVVFTKK
tara:strand:- start:348 stop:935 length:588 start_codon:yes stop_codon:yes gene_type:complete